MPPSSRSFLAGTVLLTALIAACEGNLDLPWDGNGRLQVPEPQRFPQATGTGVVSPTATPLVVDYGNGVDGPLNVGAAGTIVNACSVLVSSSGAKLEISAGAFLAGERVLVIQMQDALTTASGDATPIVDPGATGLWDLGRVVVGNGPGATVILGAPLQRSYGTTADRKAQLCRIPQYTNVNLDGARSIVAPEWNGSTGGVVGLIVRDTFDLRDAAQLSASGRGYLGGAKSASTGVAMTTTTEDTSPTAGGGKGGGMRVATADGSGANGRGNLDVGAGGGNARNAGGGGGGAAGAGGFGGMEADEGNPSPSLETRGRGGVAVIAGPERLLMGGGGGGGHDDENVGTAGVDGGGIVVVFAQRIKGALGVINAGGLAGALAGDFDQGDGAGGGGGGGTVLVVTDDFSEFTGTIRANGGSGGSVGVTTTSRYGPGGGGGGGRIFIFRGTDSTTAMLSTSGGTPGLNGNGAGAHGAERGSAGITTRLPLP